MSRTLTEWPFTRSQLLMKCFHPAWLDIFDGGCRRGVVDHHAPAAVGPHVDIGGEHTTVRAALVRDRDVLVDAVHGHHHCLQQMLLADLEAHVLRAREYLPPRFAHLNDACDALSAGMHAVDL